MHTVVIVDDHAMIRRGFASYLAGTGRFAIAGEAGSLPEAQELFDSFSQAPDLVLLDIELEMANGLDLLGWLKKRYKKKAPAVLVYSIYEDPIRIQAALHQGARGYVSKSASEEEIAAALEAILNNETYLEPKLAEKITEKPNLYRVLTKQERIILELIQKNYDNHKIARELSLNLRTVENYLSRLYAKTGVQSRGDLVKL